jgi:hypothetical protein
MVTASYDLVLYAMKLVIHLGRRNKCWKIDGTIKCGTWAGCNEIMWCGSNIRKRRSNLATSFVVIFSRALFVADHSAHRPSWFEFKIKDVRHEKHLFIGTNMTQYLIGSPSPLPVRFSSIVFYKKDGSIV